MSVSLSEENEVERILRELQGTDAAHGRAGILLVDKSDFRLLPGSGDIFPEDLPPVVRDTIARLDRIIEEADDDYEKLRATRALGHLYKTAPELRRPLRKSAMKIRRLHVTDFAAIREADVEFGPGLNVLFGPNDLGKSTLAEAIRLALLLPHTSTHIDEYIPWTGGQNPVVELTFETESQRIWRVRKEFRKGGAATLEESRNGVDFDPVERARKVDAKLREILRWGIPEPGGAGGGKGLPSSFLGTALLSTQADVTSVLSQSLSDDPTGTGKERIAAALRAVAQDPLFAALLRETQVRRDQAYTERGAKKTARGSVFKDAADRVNETRNEKERLQKLVDDSESVEKELRKLMATHIQREEALASAAEHVKIVEQLASQAAALSAAVEQVRIAREAVERIRGIDREIAAAEHNLQDLAVKVARGRGGSQGGTATGHSDGDYVGSRKESGDVRRNGLRYEAHLRTTGPRAATSGR